MAIPAARSPKSSKYRPTSTPPGTRTAKAIYQRYLGWYDGNPAHLWQHPPQAAGQRYARLAGGIEELAAKAREFLEEGDLRFAAELASHAVFAEPDSTEARTVLADALTRLGP
jgi:alkyl sulfatase BDS1-like metallo-beta-lactamase superfamily hydrolase